MPKNSGFYKESPFTVDNSFTDISLLHSSENGYSEVYKALRHGKWHVVKCLTVDERQNPRFQQLLRKEFEISFQLTHPGVVHTLGMENVDELGACIIQEYIDGVTWDDFFLNNKISNKEIKRIISELCLAMNYIHQRQIVHRDITPKNILLTRDGHHVRIIDFGLADHHVFAYLKEPAGTTGYASPEQQKPSVLDNRSDIYSLGVLIDGIASQSNLRMRLIARKCLAYNPEKRFVSVMEIYNMMRPSSWWKWLSVAAIAVAIAIITTWLLPKGASLEQEERIGELNQQSEKQKKQIQSQQKQISAQQAYISKMEKEMADVSSQVGTVKVENNIISERIGKEDKTNEGLRQAKNELHSIADEQYKKIWDSHSELANEPSKRRDITNSEIYFVDWHPIVSHLVKKYNLNKAGDDITGKEAASKILMDEWLTYLYKKTS